MSSLITLRRAGRTSGSDPWDTEMRDDGEPISRGQLDHRAAERRAINDALCAGEFIAGIVLGNGILAILPVGFAQAIGWWDVRAREGAAAAALVSGALAPIANRPE